jgi:hypothetical protein
MSNARRESARGCKLDQFSLTLGRSQLLKPSSAATRRAVLAANGARKVRDLEQYDSSGEHILTYLSFPGLKAYCNPHGELRTHVYYWSYANTRQCSTPTSRSKCAAHKLFIGHERSKDREEKCNFGNLSNLIC